MENTSKQRRRAHLKNIFGKYIALFTKSPFRGIKKVKTLWFMWDEVERISTMIYTYENALIDLNKNVKGLHENEVYHLDWFYRTRISELRDDYYDKTGRRWQW